MKQDDYRKMCDEVTLSEEQKEKIWAAARVKMQAKKENKQKIGRFAGIAMAAAAIIVFFMVAVMPGIIRNKNTNQPAAQVEKSTEEENGLQVADEDVKSIGTRYYLLLGIDSRTDDMKDAQADAIILLGLNVNTKMVQVISIPNQFDLGEKKAVDYNWKDQGKDGLREAIARKFEITINGQAAASFRGFAQIVNSVGGLELEVTAADLDPKYAQLNGYLTEVVESTGIATKGQITELGMQLLDGPQTVAWCRVRDTEDGVRGQRFLTAFSQLGKKLIEQTEKPEFLVETGIAVMSDLKIDASFSKFYVEEASMFLFDEPQITYIDLANTDYTEVFVQ